MASMLTYEIKTQLREFFAELKNPVELVFFSGQQENCEYCEETRVLLEEVAALDKRITIRVYDHEKDFEVARNFNIENIPGFTILGWNEDKWIDFGIRYAGIPAGHEFTSLINDILIVSKGESGLAPETREALTKINLPIILQVFVTPTCPYCPRAVILAHQMALESPFIQAEMVEAMEFNKLASRYGVSGVPHTVINNGAGGVIGAVPEEHLLQKIQEVISYSKIGEVN